MTTDHQASPEPTHLPSTFLDRFTNPFVRFLQIESAGGVILLLFTVSALILTNSPWATSFEHIWETRLGIQFGSFEFACSLREWINDGMMTLFIFLVAIELKREFVLGELNKPRMAALSIAAALGGMIVSAVIYMVMQSGHPGEHGWGLSWQPIQHT